MSRAENRFVDLITRKDVNWMEILESLSDLTIILPLALAVESAP